MKRGLLSILSTRNGNSQRKFLADYILSKKLKKPSMDDLDWEMHKYKKRKAKGEMEEFILIPKKRNKYFFYVLRKQDKAVEA